MDPLSATASVIAILTVAVNSVQFISRIVNGSNHYRDLARTLDRLHSTLKQIADIIEKNKQTDGTNNGSAWRGLRTAAYACVDDLQELQGSLLKSKCTDEKSMRGVCLTLKTALDPSKLKNADRILNLHIQQLGLQLLVLGSFSNVSQAGLLHKLDKTIEITSKSLASVLPEIRTLILEKQSDLQIFREESVTTIQSLMHQISTKLETQQQALIKDLFRQFEQKTQREPSTARVSEISGIDINSVITDEPQIYQIASSDPLPIPKLFSGSLPGLGQKITTDDVVSGCINRLCSLFAPSEHGIKPYQAREVIDDLEKILQSIEIPDRSTQTSHNSRGKRKAIYLDDGIYLGDPGQSSNLVAEVRKVVGVSKSIALAQELPRRKLHGFKGPVESESDLRTYKIKDGTVMINCVKRRRRINSFDAAQTAHKSYYEVQCSDTVETFAGVFSLLMPNGAHKMKLNLSFLQRFTNEGLSMIHPALSAHPMIPEDSEIFMAIADRDLERFVELLETGQASLTDCDVKGRSLLNHAIYSLSPDICRFLIEHHADVDSMETDLLNSAICTPLEQNCKNDYEITQEDEIMRNISCKRLLLEAGADPTIYTIDWDNRKASLTNFIFYFSVATLRQCLDLGRLFIEIDELDPARRITPLLFIIQWLPDRNGQELFEKIKILLEHGANINAIDPHRRGCLHIAFCSRVQGLKRGWGWDEAYFWGIVEYLIEKGADIYAAAWCRACGGSVTQAAFASHGGRLWLRTLDACPYTPNAYEVLVEDHQRYHQRSGHILPSSHQRGESVRRESCQGTCDILTGDEKSHHSHDVSESGSHSRPLPQGNITFDLHQDCEWSIWEHIDIESVRKSDDGGRSVIEEWYREQESDYETDWEISEDGEDEVDEDDEKDASGGEDEEYPII